MVILFSSLLAPVFFCGARQFLLLADEIFDIFAGFRVKIDFEPRLPVS
jgi:hypothetical protein